MLYGRGADPSANSAQPTARDDIAALLERAACLAAPVLTARGQTLSIESGAHGAVIERRGARLCTLMACAIHEMSGCTVRGGSISCATLHHAVLMRGDNPIIVPEHALSLDWMMLVRAKALGVRPLLDWEQSRGPLLTLMLPAARTAPAGRAPALAEGLPA
jgi:hypothetical protein